MEVIEIPTAGEVAAMDADTRRAALRHLADAEAVVAVARSRVITAEEHSKRYKSEAFRTIREMVQATANLARTRAVVQVRLANAVTGLPWLAEAMLAGRVGIDQADEIALLYANPACRKVLDSLAGILVEQAQQLWFDGFRILCRHVRDLADPDGSAADHETNWRNRRVTSTVVADGWQARVFGDGLSAAEFDTLLELYTQIEFDRDWAAARTLHGDQTCAEVLARTHQQRRFDALLAIIHTAADHTPQLRQQPLTNIVVDQQTAEDVVAEACGGAVPTVDVATELFDRAARPTPVNPSAATNCCKRCCTAASAGSSSTPTDDRSKPPPPAASSPAPSATWPAWATPTAPAAPAKSTRSSPKPTTPNRSPTAASPTSPTPRSSAATTTRPNNASTSPTPATTTAKPTPTNPTAPRSPPAPTPPAGGVNRPPTHPAPTHPNRAQPPDPPPTGAEPASGPDPP